MRESQSNQSEFGEIMNERPVNSIYDVLFELRRIKKEMYDEMSRLKQKELNAKTQLYIIQTKSTRDAYGLFVKHIAWLIRKIEEMLGHPLKENKEG